jgi:hypothetical protein
MREAGAVQQRDRFGCALACLATVLGRTYEDVRDEIGDPGRGLTDGAWCEFLAAQGYAVQHLYRVHQLTQAKRDVWPAAPWAPVLLCLVDAGGPGGHLVVMLYDGTVLDPAGSGEPVTLAAYASVMAMTGLFYVSRSPAPATSGPVEPEVVAGRAAVDPLGVVVRPHHLIEGGSAAVVGAQVHVGAEGDEDALQPAEGQIPDVAALQGGELPPRDTGLIGEAGERHPQGEPAGADGGSKLGEVDAHVG